MSPQKEEGGSQTSVRVFAYTLLFPLRFHMFVRSLYFNNRSCGIPKLSRTLVWPAALWEMKSNFCPSLVLGVIPPILWWSFTCKLHFNDKN